MHSPELGDYIGVESCVDLKPDVADTPSHSGGAGMNLPRCRWRWDVAEKEYPPPIPLLARTENLPSHMPWVMKRYYTSDGRLVIKEEKVKHHEYFQAHRSNGRLVLKLVPLDDAVEESCKEHRCGGGEEKLDCPENMAVPGEEINDGDEGISDPAVEEVLAECYKYNGIGVNPCGGFGVAVAAFRPPVHT
ncbi:hypothetical protein Pfo_021723 [Paulownia fortunei]|nr:hypothetical protein Pfo_021723 [Paulownia fortunei]